MYHSLAASEKFNIRTVIVRWLKNYIIPFLDSTQFFLLKSFSDETKSVLRNFYTEQNSSSSKSGMCVVEMRNTSNEFEDSLWN